jgi:mono/diheme cytochrome c family protein
LCLQVETVMVKRPLSAWISATVLAALCATALMVPATVAEETADAASLALGEALFVERCATCHGTDAKGDGPAAAALKVPPANLTEISKRAGGTFPSARIVEVITYGGNIAAHGSGPMPVWGLVFSEEGGRGKIGAARSRQSIIALKRYLETIQK